MKQLVRFCYFDKLIKFVQDLQNVNNSLLQAVILSTRIFSSKHKAGAKSLLPFVLGARWLSECGKLSLGGEENPVYFCSTSTMDPVDVSALT